MTNKYVPKLRQLFLEDMRIKGFLPKTHTMFLRVMREFTRFLGHSPDTATPEDGTFQLIAARPRRSTVCKPFFDGYS